MIEIVPRQKNIIIVCKNCISPKSWIHSFCPISTALEYTLFSASDSAEEDGGDQSEAGEQERHFMDAMPRRAGLVPQGSQQADVEEDPGGQTLDGAAHQLPLNPGLRPVQSRPDPHPGRTGQREQQQRSGQQRPAESVTGQMHGQAEGQQALKEQQRHTLLQQTLAPRAHAQTLQERTHTHAEEQQEHTQTQVTPAVLHGPAAVLRTVH